MTEDFMSVALNYQPGIRIAPSSKWVITNGTARLPLCDACKQPVYEGHIDCTCDKNHPERCERPTYDQLGEHLRRIAGDNMDFAMRYRKVLQGLLDKGTLSPIDAAEIEAALAWVGD
jgi:hypothetical protein